jgi:AGZA family xanthine/uracil permease-like MFS transporter
MINRIFRLTEHGTTPVTEILAGASTFLTMAFIIAVNPAILSDAGMDFGAAFIATILATVIGTLIMGLYAGWPVAVAPGMGLNAYFAYAVILGYGLSWQQALAAVFVSSLLFFIFSASKLRSYLILSIPGEMQIAITAGIGLFLGLIGLMSAGIVIDNPDTIVGLGALNKPELILSVMGLIMMAGLSARSVKGSILISIMILSAVGWASGLAPFGGVFSAPPAAGALFALDFSALASTAFLSVVFVMFFVDFFDTTGTLTAIADPAGKRRDTGEIDGLNKAVMADTSASIFGSLLGTSTMTTYLESAAGLRDGGRTGLTAVTVAFLFLCCLFLEPLFASIPSFATAPALIFVASTFLGGLRGLDWSDIESGVPVFITILVMPLTFSIAAGIALGFLTHVGIKLIMGKGTQISGGVWIITLFGLIWMVLQTYA